jgi:putative aldouronate transport system substrate-binding protein
MGKKSNKVLTVIVIMLMLAFALAGCAKKTTSSETSGGAASTAASAGAKSETPQDFVTLKILMPGDESKRMSDFLANELGKKLKDDLNLALDITYVPWSNYNEKLSLMLATGEQLDLFWNTSVKTAEFLAKKEILPLDELFEKNAQDMKKVIPPENIESSKVKGSMMFIPNTNVPSSNMFMTVLARQDILDDIGITQLKTLDDLEKAAAAVKSSAKYKTMNIFADPMTGPLSRVFFDKPVIYDLSHLGFDLSTNKVFSFFESEGFKKMAQTIGKWKQNGWMNDEVTIKPNEGGSRITSGNYVFSTGAVSLPMENINQLKQNAPTGRYKEYILNPEKPNYRYQAVNDVQFIGKSSKYPDRAMQFLNWIYKSKDNYNFAIYGVAGKDYNLENGRIKQINKDELFYEWMFRNNEIMDFPDSVDDDFINTYKNWDKGAIISDMFGITFDETAVSTEQTKINTIEKAQLKPIATGFVDFNEYYPKAIEDIKSAGIDKVITEFQKQIEAFMAARKK